MYVVLSGCTGNILILWRAETIREVLHFKVWRWKVVKLEDTCSLGVRPGWLKASSPHSGAKNQKNRELIVSQKKRLLLKVSTQRMKAAWLKRKVKHLIGSLVTTRRACAQAIIKCKEGCFLDNKHHSSRLFSHIRSECEDVCQSPTLNSGRKILQCLLKTIFLQSFDGAGILTFKLHFLNGWISIRFVVQDRWRCNNIKQLQEQKMSLFLPSHFGFTFCW